MVWRPPDAELLLPRRQSFYLFCFKLLLKLPQEEPRKSGHGELQHVTTS